MASRIRSNTGGKPGVKRGKESRKTQGEFANNKRATTGGIAKESYTSSPMLGGKAPTDKSGSVGGRRNSVGNDATAGNSRRSGALVDKPRGTAIVGSGGRNSITGNGGRMV